MARALSVRLASDPAQALPFLQRAQAHAVHAYTCRELIAGEAVFELLADGQPVGAFTLGVFDQGRELHCGAAGGESGFDLVGTMTRFAAAEAKRIGAKRLVCETRRPGLVRRLQREGYRVSYILTKDIA